MSKGYVTIPVGYSRVDGEPLELNTVFRTLEDANKYAASDLSYAGQVIAVVNSKVTIYTIVGSSYNENGTAVRPLKLRQIYTPELTYDIGESPMIIDYNLDHLPNVTIVDSDGNICECQITYENTDSTRRIIISWNGSLEGAKVYLR
jgi:hypothetical protein